MPSKRPLPKGLFVTRGGRKVARLLKRTNTGMSEFAARAGVSRVTLHSVIHGQRWKYITVDFALAVADASDGTVLVQDFASITATPVGEVADEDDGRRRRTGTDG